MSSWYIVLSYMFCPLQRPRPAAQYVDQLEWDVDEDEFIVVRGYDALAKFTEYESRGDCGLVREMRGEGVYMCVL